MTIHFSFNKLIGELSPPRDPSRWPFFNLDRALAAPDLQDLEVSFIQSPVNYANFDLGLNVTQIRKELLIAVDYKTSIFEGQTIQSWMEHYEVLLRAIGARPEMLLSELPALEFREVPCKTKLDQRITYVAPLTDIEKWLPNHNRKTGSNVSGRRLLFELGGTHYSLQLISCVGRTRIDVTRVDVRQPTIANLARCIEQKLTSLTSHRYPRSGEYPQWKLAFLWQQRLWFIEQLIGNVAYNPLGAVREGYTRRRGARARITEIIKRHESLRTTFAIAADETRFKSLKPGTLQVAACRLKTFPWRARAGSLNRGQADACTPFDLANDSLMRVAPLHRPQEHVVILTMHHIK
jgi:hypothetical protein